MIVMFSHIAGALMTLMAFGSDGHLIIARPGLTEHQCTALGNTIADLSPGNRIVAGCFDDLTKEEGGNGR
jgi:hypothetical protein